MPLIKDTVAIPVARGINVNTPARLVDAQELLEAKNVRFTAPAGARKRRGHTGQKIRGAKAIPADWTPPTFARPTFVEPFYTGDRSVDSEWYYGYGYTPFTGIATHSVALQTSDHPDGTAIGVATRDNETLVWDGHRLLSRTNLDLPGGRLAEFPAVMPALRSEPFAKVNIAQTKPDVADNGTIRVAAWVSSGRAYYSVFDSSTGALIAGPSALAPLSVLAVRAVPVGEWVQLLVASNDTGTLEVFGIHSTTPSSATQRSYGECNGYFDVWKASETAFVVAQSRTTEIQVRLAAADGVLFAAANFSADVSGATGITAVALCMHPTTQRLALAWRTATQVQARSYLVDGTTQGTVKTLGTVTSAIRGIAIAPKYLLNSSDEEAFNVYWDDWTTYSTLSIARWTRADGLVYSASCFHFLVGSQAFRVGDRTFVWAARNSTYQSSWVLLDETLKPVGRGEYVSANTPVGTDAAYTGFSVNWTGDAPEKDRSVYHCALSTRVRVAVPVTAYGVNPPAVYSEPYIKFARLDFLPRLRWAQAGRTTYFAGAQIWAYDGAELTEANFLLAPEGVTVAAGGAGDLTASGVYTWRVDLCYRNAQNEEIRSASFYTDALTLTGGQNSATLTIPTALTRRENSYFLIFRNEDAGTVWYLCNSRDPSSALFLRNDQSVRQVTFTDSTVSDAELISREQHPNQSFDYLDPFAAPAAEVIAAGCDRVWLAGGEIPAGQVYPSRLFEPGEVPAFHSNLAVQVDRSIEPITAIGFVGEYAVFSRRTQNYILEGPGAGPDNNRQGAWNTPREPQTPTNIGAVGQESVAKIPGGLIFQTPAGIRLFTGDALVPIGQPVDSLAKTLNITSAVVVGQDQEVRFYGWDGTTLVYNYQYGTWSTWDIAAAGAALDLTTDLAVVATPEGSLLREADGVWNDDGRTYKMRIRFAWLRAGQLIDYQRVRRIAFVGEASTPHKVHIDVYYNEREFAEEWFDENWPNSDVDNMDEFGNGNFGDGNFGDVLP